MNVALKELKLGKVDGKFEYIEPQSERDIAFYDAFLIPESVDVQRLRNNDMFFVEGFRGTGKTSLLRWFANECRKNNSSTDFILFKSDIPEDRRLKLSVESGVSWVDTDPGKMEFSQDFKQAWTWFMHHKIGEHLSKNLAQSDKEPNKKYLRTLGLADNSPYQKVLGFLPKLDGSKVSIKADVGFFSGELQGDFTQDGERGRTSLEALNRLLFNILSDVELGRHYIFFDELEVFYDSQEKYERDQRLVRDLLFVVSNFNDFFSRKNIDAHVIAAVRSEVVDAFGASGQEVDRLVHDKGFTLAWHFAKRSLSHPLIEIIRRKIKSSDSLPLGHDVTDRFLQYFPKNVNGMSVDAFLLDKSFYKPRDIIWRLTIAQKQFPTSKKFTEEILHQSEIEYSSKLWDEIRYELSAIYSRSEIDAIETGLSGGSSNFDFTSISKKFEAAAKFSQSIRHLSSKHGMGQILSDLYRLGAIGNRYRAGTSGSDMRQRWAFRGDIGIMYDQKMTIHPGLMKRLSVSPDRKRSRPGGARGGTLNEHQVPS